MKVRIGMEGGRSHCINRARELGAPVLVSANSLWDQKRQRFSGWQCYAGLDLALDSGGFVAMARYGGYRWRVDQYVDLARAMAPSWWAQMDFCCEPEVVKAGGVAKRIDATVDHLLACQGEARRAGVKMPMPVLQGWHPADYCSGPIYGWREWPELVGIGSVCRRNVYGADGILAVLEALDRRVPPGVRFHLFGVKSAVLALLLERFPERVASVDSMAWSVAYHWDCRHARTSKNGADRAERMAQWYGRQMDALRPKPQLTLGL